MNITIRIVTPRVSKDMNFDDVEKANKYAKQVYDVVGRPKEYRALSAIDGTVHVIQSEMFITELHDKGLSFFGAVTVPR